MLGFGEIVLLACFGVLIFSVRRWSRAGSYLREMSRQFKSGMEAEEKRPVRVVGPRED